MHSRRDEWAKTAHTTLLFTHETRNDGELRKMFDWRLMISTNMYLKSLRFIIGLKRAHGRGGKFEEEHIAGKASKRFVKAVNTSHVSFTLRGLTCSYKSQNIIDSVKKSFQGTRPGRAPPVGTCPIAVAESSTLEWRFDDILHRLQGKLWFVQEAVSER